MFFPKFLFLLFEIKSVLAENWNYRCVLCKQSVIGNYRFETHCVLKDFRFGSFLKPSSPKTLLVSSSGNILSICVCLRLSLPLLLRGGTSASLVAGALSSVCVSTFLMVSRSAPSITTRCHHQRIRGQQANNWWGACGERVRDAERKRRRADRHSCLKNRMNGRNWDYLVERRLYGDIGNCEDLGFSWWDPFSGLIELDALFQNFLLTAGKKNRKIVGISWRDPVFRTLRRKLNSAKCVKFVTSRYWIFFDEFPKHFEKNWVFPW